MEYKQLFETMTDDAYRIEVSIRSPADWKSPARIAEQMGMGCVEVEFILQQMVEFQMAHKNVFGGYSLTPAYRKAYRDFK